MSLTTTKQLHEQVAFKTVSDVTRALQNAKLKSDVREIVSSTEYQTLVKHLGALKRPFGVIIVTPKEI